jgi:hypothetical protein
MATSTTPLRTLFCLAAAAALAAALAACRGTGGLPDAAGPPPATRAAPAPATAAAAPCTAPPEWFPHDQTPQPDDDADFTSNCMFHQWSWQSFLWLTQTMPDGELRFETFARPSELMRTDGAAPEPFPGRSPAGGLALAPRTVKQAEPTMLDEVDQAGSLGLLVDQDERSVYYSMYVNQVFYDFVRDNGLYDPEKLAATSPTLDFPVGAMELKAAWKIVEEADAAAGWTTRQATIAALSEEDGVVVVSPTESLEVTVALVGLHIAGVVNGHPEFIWATFEHDENAPTLSDQQLAAYLGSGSDIDTQPVSPSSFTFYAAGTPFEDSNQNNAGRLALDEAAQTLTPVTNAFIQYAQGGGNAANRANVVSLNASVLAQLDDPVARRYLLGGAIWLAANDGLVPNSTQQDLITGSTDLSNVTMETFTQKVLEQRNCFGCHNTMQRFPPTTGTGVAPLPGLNVNVSHILVNHYFQASQRQSLAAGATEEGE